ncbi:hypothetical protein [Nitratifractor sp.]
MSDIDIVLTLVFSIVMLLFMSYPAMKVSEWLEERFSLDPNRHALRVIVLTILFSLVIGLFLRYA